MATQEGSISTADAGQEVKRVQLSKLRKGAAPDLLAAQIDAKITKVFSTCLEAIEIRFGDEFDGYRHLRSKILRVGNDAKRELREALKDFEIRKVKEVVEYRNIPRKGNKDESGS